MIAFNTSFSIILMYLLELFASVLSWMKLGCIVQMMKIAVIGIVLMLGASLLVVADTQAAEGGYSNYIPGSYGDFAMAVEPEARLTLRNDVYAYSAEGNGSVRSGVIEAGAELDVLANFTTLLYKPEVEFLGGSYALGVFVPIIYMDLDVSLTVGPLPLNQQEDTLGLGDVALIPIILFWNQGNIHTSFAQFIVTPTADYDANNFTNTGLNYWSYDTNFALTYLDLETGQDLSFNIGHIYNTENDDTNYQTGRELHLDVALNQFLSESFAVGVHGFYLKQITGDRGSGAVLGDFKAKVAGIGPAILWSKQIGTRNVIFIAKWLHEFDEENRLEGDHFFASFAMDW